MRASQTLFLLLWFFCIYAPTSFSTNVTYDHRALVINGKRRVLVSGSIHYPRSTPEVLFITLFLCLCVMLLQVHYFFLCFWSFELKGVVFVVADVARHHSKVQRWRTWCDWDLCFLELTRTSSRPGPLLFSSVDVTITTIFVLCLLFTVTCIAVCVCSFSNFLSNQAHLEGLNSTKNKCMQLRKVNDHCFTYFSESIRTM